MNEPGFDRFKDGYVGHLEKGVYRALGGEPYEYYIEVKAQELVSSSGKFAGRSGAVIDVGCGVGLAEKLLSPYFPLVAGCDISLEMLKQGQKGRPTNCSFLQCSGLVLPFRSQCAQMVFSFSLFHHVPRTLHPSLVREMARILRPGGLLVVMDHNPYNPLTQFVVKMSEVDRGAAIVTAAWLRRCFFDAGLRPVETKYILFFPRWLSFLRGLEKRMWRLPLGGQYMVSALK